MKLPQYSHELHDAALPPITQVTLIRLYHEMINVARQENQFDQSDCCVCVIGNGIRAGLFAGIAKSAAKHGSGYSMQSFDKAVSSLDLPEIHSAYLFQGPAEVIKAGEILNLPTGIDGVVETHGVDKCIPIVDFTPLDACVRIAALLNRAGYDISELPDVSV